MESKVLADSGMREPAALQQHWRAECATRDDDRLGDDLQRSRCSCAGTEGGDCTGHGAVFKHQSLRLAVGQDAGAVGDRLRQMKSKRGLLRSDLAAERAGPAVAALSAVHLNALAAPAELLGAANDCLVFQWHILGVLCANLLQYRVEVTSKLTPAGTGNAVFPLPLLAHRLRDRNSGHPVHGGAATNGAAREDRDVCVGGGGEA